jgi:predicted ester cyclase
VSATQNEELLRRYISDVWDAGDPEAARRYLASEYRRHTSPTAAHRHHRPTGEAPCLREAFPDITVEVEDVITAHDQVAFRSTMRGTHPGTFLGTAATGRTVKVVLIDIIRIENGRLVEQWGGPDLFDLTRQLGSG